MAWNRDYLVDYMQVRYAEPYQAAYRSDAVFQLPLQIAQGQGEWDINGLPQALREYPPTVTAAAWVAQVPMLGQTCCTDPLPCPVHAAALSHTPRQNSPTIKPAALAWPFKPTVLEITLFPLAVCKPALLGVTQFSCRSCFLLHSVRQTSDLL